MAELGSSSQDSRPAGIGRRVLSAALLAIALVACEASADAPDEIPVLTSDRPLRVTTTGNVPIEIRSDAPIRKGKNTLFVSFPAHDGELASASALMPAHAHGGPTPVIERDGNTFVIKDLVLFMSGRWELRLAVAASDREHEAVVAIDVP